MSTISPIHIKAGDVDSVHEVICQVDQLIETIVVDEKPPDSTLEVPNWKGDSKANSQLHSNTVNQGIGEVNFWGLNTTKAFLRDSGLIGVVRRQVLDLMLPVFKSPTNPTINQLQSGDRWVHTCPPSIAWLCGQGCNRQNLLGQISLNLFQEQGIEAALSITVAQNQRRCIRFPFNSTWHPMNIYQKGLWSGIRTRARIYKRNLFAWHQSGGYEGVKCGYA